MEKIYQNNWHQIYAFDSKDTKEAVKDSLKKRKTVSLLGKMLSDKSVMKECA